MTVRELIAELERYQEADFPVWLDGGERDIVEVRHVSNLYGMVNWIELVADDGAER